MATATLCDELVAALIIGGDNAFRELALQIVSVPTTSNPRNATGVQEDCNNMLIPGWSLRVEV